MVTLISGFIFMAYYIGTRRNTEVTYKIEVPEIKINYPEKIVKVKDNEHAVKIQKEFEKELEKQKKEQERLPEQQKVMNDVNETVNTIYEAFLNGTPIEDNSNDA